MNANQWLQDQLDEKGHSAPNTDLRRAETLILLNGYANVIESESGPYVGFRAVSEEVAQAMTEWDKRYFIVRIGTGTAFFRYNGKRCKVHGNDGFRLDEHRLVIHGESCQKCENPA